MLRLRLPILHRPSTPGQGGALFGLIVGLIVGALATTAIVPNVRSTVRVIGGPATNALDGVSAGTQQRSGSHSATAGGSAAVPGASAGAPSGGRSAAGASTRAGSGATTAPARATPGAAARGVSASVIRIGVAYPDLTGLKALGPAYDNGNVPAQWNALLKGWQQAHRTPIAGRTIQFFFKSYNVVDVNDQNAACRSLIEDDHVFMVIGVAYFETGSDCVARQFRTPLITNDGPTDAVSSSGSPYLFSMLPTTGRTLRNWIYWAKARNLLAGKKIGVYYAADPVSTADAQQNVIRTLQRLGYPIAAQATTQHTLGGPEDAVAVQKFRSAGVSIALLLASKAGFMQQADAQAYKPRYIESDYLFGTSDTTTSNYPADQWDGTYAVTASTEGATASGKPLGRGTADCINNYNRQTGSHVAIPGRGQHETAEYGYILMSCDEGDVLLAALNGAGRALTSATFVTGMHAITGLDLRRVGKVNFAHRDDGADEQRTLVWRRGCACYQVATDWARMYTS